MIFINIKIICDKIALSTTRKIDCENKPRKATGNMVDSRQHKWDLMFKSLFFKNKNTIRTISLKKFHLI